MSDRALVLCLGNLVRRDDGVGWRVAEALLADPPRGAEVRMSALSGLYLLDEMEGFDRVVVVDAVATGDHDPGTVSAFPLSAIRGARAESPRGLGLPAALSTAEALGAPLPPRIDVVAIEVAGEGSADAGLTPAVAAAVPVAAVRVREALATEAPAPNAPAPLSGGAGLSGDRWFP